MTAVKIVMGLIVLGFAGLVGYAYFGDLRPAAQEQSVEISLPPPAARNGN
jgi:hypothetical protein